MDKLTEANLEQSTVSKQLFVSGDVQVDSRPLVADIKLNILHQYVQGKPQQVVIGTEDQTPVLYCTKGLETVMLWVQHLLTNMRNGLR